MSGGNKPPKIADDEVYLRFTLTNFLRCKAGFGELD